MTMHCWYFDKKELRNTPSSADGIDYDTELRYRREGARFIIDTGTKMDLGCNTIATGVVYFHRFYMFHSFRNFPRYVTASCCLFLAGKVEETPKKCRDIIRSAKLSLPDSKFATFGDDPKEEVMTLERILLQTIKFDLQVDHPYHFLVKYAKCLKGDKTKLQKMVQMAWTFVNDSLCTTLCLQWEPEIIAVALMYLAGKLSKFEALDWTGRQPKHLRWWDMFIEDVTMDLLEDICHQVLDLYSQPQTANQPDSPPPPPLPKSKPEPPPPPMEASVIPTIVNAHPIQSVVPPVKMMKTVPPMKVHQAIDIPKLPIDTLKPPPPIPMDTFQYPPPPYPPGPPPAAVPIYPPGPYPPPPPPTAAFPPPFYPPPPV